SQIELFKKKLIDMVILGEYVCRMARTSNYPKETLKDMRYVEKNIADEIMEYVEHYGLESIKTEEDTKRYYPQNELAAQVIGFTNSDGEGQYVLEYNYNKYFSCTNGRVLSATDARGKEMPYRYSTTYPAEDGSSLYLTLDSTLQYYLEKNLQAMCEKFRVRNRACGIIMNAKTGAIYAMGTYPSFDLNNPPMIYDQATNEALQMLPKEEYQEAYISAREQQWKNKAITELYIPGSVFKIFTTAMAVEEKVVNPETDSFFCNGAYPIPGVPKPIHCHKLAGHGAQTFSEALTNSCNPAFIEVGLRVGVHKFSQYFDAFGLTEKTGIDLPGETSSIYREEKDLGIVDLASSAFGQSNKLTPMEMITGIAAAINGGYLVEPHVVDKIVSSDGNIIKNFNTNIKRQVISEESSATVRELLQAVVDNNGGSNAYIKGYAIGGKSGTSQKLDQYSDDNMQYVASYACFAPADDPEIVMLLLADEPDPSINYYGSVVTAPYARDIMAEALPYLGYYPEYTSEEYAKLDVTVPQLRDADIASAKQTLEEFGLRYEIKGNGNTIVSQCPDTGSTVSAGGKIILYTEENYEPEMIQVPNVMKYRADDASELLTEAGLNYVSQGASTDRTDVLVGDQSVEPGTFVEAGTVIRLDYVVNDQSG
ncbi:MAG: PASTA domain-containing protein, partial [Oscillospiraceae bacterium]|nr:PASTA domain-containing protein [Oscillospiraceae bacterium]